MPYNAQLFYLVKIKYKIAARNGTYHLFTLLFRAVCQLPNE